MCLALYTPAGKTPKVGHMRQAFASNRDGAGFAYANGSKRLTFVRGLWTAKEFETAWAEVASKHPALIHFRLATHGTHSIANCHPFPILDGKFALIHNGILKIPGYDSARVTFGKKDNAATVDAPSDTRYFAEEIVEPLLKEGIDLHSEAFRKLMEMAIDGDKVCIMDAAGKVAIFGESDGHWHKGIWYSNSSYKGHYGFSRSAWDDNDFATAHGGGKYYGGNGGTYYHQTETGKWVEEERKTIIIPPKSAEASASVIVPPNDFTKPLEFDEAGFANCPKCMAIMTESDIWDNNGLCPSCYLELANVGH